MRIGIDSRGIYPQMEGIGRYSLELIRGLAEVDRTNEYVLFKNATYRDKLVDAPNFTEYVIPYTHLTIRTCIKLPVTIRKLNVDVFHSLFFVAPLWGIKNLIVTVHDLMALTFPGFFSGRNWAGEKSALVFHKLLVPRSLKRAKKLIAVSSQSRNEIISLLNIPNERIAIIPEAATSEFRPIEERWKLIEFRKRWQLPEDYILYLGNSKPYKNIMRLIEAFKYISQKIKNVKLVISGKKDRFHPLVKKKVRDMDLEKDVIFFKDVYDQDLPLLYNCASAFVFPSLAEGFGLPVLEALSCGVPVIISDIPALMELIDGAGLAVNPLDERALAGAIEQILSDSKLRKTLKEKGLRRAKDFSWRRTAEKTLEEYRRIVCEVRQ